MQVQSPPSQVTEESTVLSPEDIELNNIVSTKMLFKSDFEPLSVDQDLRKKLLLLKLNDDYKEALEKYRKQKEK